jgi:ubiquinone/menaquinone biosynthesis C-methylase UbiE
MAGHAQLVTACDLSSDMLDAVQAEAARRGITNIATTRAAAEDLPFADDSLIFWPAAFPPITGAMHCAA